VRRGEDLAHRQLAADRCEPALEAPRQGCARVLGNRFLKGVAPCPRVRGLRRPGDVEQPRPAVLLQQMASQRFGAGPVVGVYDIGAWLIERAGHQHDRDARRQLRQLLGADNALSDEHPVDLRRDLLHLPEGARAVGLTQDRDQYRPSHLSQ
jgi:hypothetical protein